METASVGRANVDTPFTPATLIHGHLNIRPDNPMSIVD